MSVQHISHIMVKAITLHYMWCQGLLLKKSGVDFWVATNLIHTTSKKLTKFQIGCVITCVLTDNNNLAVPNKTWSWPMHMIALALLTYATSGVLT